MDQIGLQYTITIDLDRISCTSIAFLFYFQDSCPIIRGASGDELEDDGGCSSHSLSLPPFLNPISIHGVLQILQMQSLPKMKRDGGLGLSLMWRVWLGEIAKEGGVWAPSTLPTRDLPGGFRLLSRIYASVSLMNFKLARASPPAFVPNTVLVDSVGVTRTRCRSRAAWKMGRYVTTCSTRPA
jgi:hypothetical protein